MNRPGAILFKGSMVLNLLLTGYLIYVGGVKNRFLAPPEQPSPVQELAAEEVEMLLPHDPASTSAPFQWNQVESEDYPGFIANLRAIGCPEPVIRAIVLKELEEHYERHYGDRWRAARAKLGRAFWTGKATGRTEFEALRSEAHAEMAVISEKFNRTFRQLFDVLPHLFEFESDWETSAHRQIDQGRLAFLPQSKQALLIEQELALARTQHELQSSGLGQEEVRVRIAALRDQINREREELLTPEELEEYNLRHSRHAWVGRNRTGFEPTDDERRAMIRLRESLKPNLPRKESDQRLAELLAELVGPARSAEYQRALDSDFQLFSTLSSRLNLPAHTAAQAYAAKQAAEQAARQVLVSPDIRAGHRGAVLEEIQFETEAFLRDLLQPAGYEAYRNQHGAWIDRLLSPP